MHGNHILRKIFATIIPALTIIGCGTQQSAPDSGFAQYIEAYTGGIVNGGSNIVIELVSPAEGLDGTESELNSSAKDLFKFSPSIKGTAKWRGAQRVEFIPEDGELKPGKRYDCTFYLSKVASTDSEHKNFKFSFTTAPKQASLQKTAMSIKADDKGNAIVTGTLTLSEDVEVSEPASLLEFGWNEDGAAFEVNAADARRFTFTASGLKRGSEDKTLTVRFKPGRTGFAECSELKVCIPSADSFRVLDTEQSDGEDKYIYVTFSQPLSQGQDLRGLVSLTSYGSSSGLRSTMSMSDNRIKIYYESDDEAQMQLEIDKRVRDIDGNRLGENWMKTLATSTPAPHAGFLSNGNILPDTRNLVIPFHAQNLRAVDVSILEIYPKNIPMFLQDNDLNGDNSLRRAGRLVYKNTLMLDSDPSKDLTRNNVFTVDLSGLFNKEPGAIYRMKISFRQEYYLYSNAAGSLGGDNLISLSSGQMSEEDEAVWDEPYPYYYDGNYDWSRYNWRDRNNPRTPSYYMNYSFPSRNFQVSNLGVITKYAPDSKTAGQVWVAVNDLISAEPVSGAEIKILNYQLQEIGSGKSGSNGAEMVKLTGRPFLTVVSKGNSTTYLKVTEGNEKSLSRFDTGGEILQKGMKGFIYGERGVWRPGDTLHLTMILHSDEKVPDTHPAIMDIYTPQGQFFTRKVCRKAENGFYTFTVPTVADSPTGLWNAYVKIGGATFHKSLRIEAIKPNRLKVNVDLGTEMLKSGSSVNVKVASNWLTGPAAASLPAKVSMTLKPGQSSFKGLEGYRFIDPASSFESYSKDLLDVRLNQDGKAQSTVTLPRVQNAPGMLTANILCSVMEDGGDESYTTLTMPYSPYSAYVGAKLPSDGDYLETGKTHNIPVAVVDCNGRRVSGHTIEWRIFKLKWSWWWESRRDPLDSYINASAASAFSSGRTTSGSGDINIPFSANDDQWGRYLIYIKDIDSGHASGGIVFADWPAYRGRSDRKDPDAPAMLSFSTDKNSYSVGETATVYIPAAKDGRALVSIENGSRVLKSEWVSTSGSGDTAYKLKITEDLSPNFYIHITLVQPYWNTSNDLPIRMYGVRPIMVENQNSHLHPVITMPDKIHPEEQFTVKVSERDKKSMTYTLTIVDEGLLDLTAFRTPDPWNTMYKREALGIRTWDMYDDVFGSCGGALSAMFSIGGDEELTKGAKKENRFNPIVKFLGPFTVNSGSRSHKITLPMYVGSVRVMVVAGQDRAYGNAEKTVPVTSPVMILPTLPRSAGTGEDITLPVNVFVMEDGISNVNVSVRCEGPVAINGSASQTLSFGKKGEQMTRFSLSTSGEGFAKVTISADGNGHKMTETINLEVVNRSPEIVSVQDALIGKGETKSFNFKPFAADDRCGLRVEASGYPSIDWDALFSFIGNYQHSCSEQLAARGLSLLYAMPMLSKTNAEKAGSMIPGILTELYGRQLPDGGFTYWPGGTVSDEWVTSMAGEFMSKAKADGYDVNSGVLSSWHKFQKRCIQNYRTAKVYRMSDLTQAYRLYTVAVAGKSDEAAMNRMKEGGELSWQASMMLASTYAVCGKKNICNNILEGLSEAPEEWVADTPVFSSPLRDKAIALEALVRSGNTSEAIVYAQSQCRGEYSEGLQPWSMTTQESVFIARAMSLLAKDAGGSNVDIEVNDGALTNRLTAKPSDNGRVSASADPASGNITVKNFSDGPAYVRVNTVSRALPGEAVAASSSGISLNVRYIGPDGNTLNPASVRQGTEFTAVIRVSNPSASADLRHIALTEMIPSGWETINERMTGQDVPSDGKYDYLDIRDNANIFYFSLPRNSYKEFRVRLRAAYEGTFVLPAVACEDMYNANVFARSASGSAQVIR